MPAVLITRPRATAEPLAVTLETLGYRTFIEPLLSIEPFNAPRPRDERPAATIITSGSALQALADRRWQVADLLDLPCFCIGPRTAEKATAYGFRLVQNAEGDGTELANLVGSILGKKRVTIFHLAGRDIDRKTHQQLEKLGHHVAIWPVYDTIPVEALTPKLRDLLEAGKLDAVTLFSPRTAEVLVKLLIDAALQPCCERLAAICLSPAVARPLEALRWRHLASVSVPAENVLIARLQEICPVPK